MKSVNLIVILLTLTSCGVGHRLCGDDVKMGCNAIFGDKPEDGLNGKNGADGKDGQSCSVVEVTDGAVITCGDTSVMVNDGVGGQDGADGQNGLDAPVNPYSVTEIIDPCGDHPNHFDEVLLKMYNGDIVAYFRENGSRQYLALIPQGNFVTTDKQQCNFSVDANGNVSW